MTSPSNAITPARPSHQHCIRCGTCCKKGGPALHRQDKQLVTSGTIPLTALFTIRAGEPVRDNIRGDIHSAATDIIKIRTKKNSSECRFHGETTEGCRIYAHRPAECVAQKCWDTEEIEEIYARERLTRMDLLEDSQSLCDLVRTHQERCDYNETGKLSAELLKTKDATVEEKLMERIRYDQSIRDLTVEKSGISPQLTDFLFGLPLAVTIRRYGLKLQRLGEEYGLIGEA